MIVRPSWSVHRNGQSAYMIERNKQIQICLVINFIIVMIYKEIAVETVL